MRDRSIQTSLTELAGLRHIPGWGIDLLNVRDVRYILISTNMYERICRKGRRIPE
jgi:hypothetical protein